MRILVVTQAVDADSSTLGFFVEWLREFSRQCEEVIVIGLSVGRHDLPSNVRVLSMGKEHGAGKASRLFRFWKHLRYALPRVDGVFIHMCPEYLIAGWPFIAASRKPVMLWYAHRQYSLRLRLAARLSHVIGTIAEGSFPFPSLNLKVMGHGIPTERFTPTTTARQPGRLAAVGRITPIKRLELLVEALAILRREGVEATLDIHGEPVMKEDHAYKTSIERLIVERGLQASVVFRGAAPYAAMPNIAASAAVALNACPTGALDKAVLEAMACGTPTVTTNTSFTSVFGPDAGRLVASDDPAEIAAKIGRLLNDHDAGLGARLRAVVEQHHSLRRLVSNVLGSYKDGGS